MNIRIYVVAFDWYVTADKAKDKAYVEACLEDSEQVQREDIWLCERVQSGLRSSVYNQGGRYAPLMEQGEYMYHQRIYKDFLKAIEKIKST
jgi:choline monooxygenase